MNLLFHNLRFIFSIMFGRRFYAKKRILWRSLRGQKETDKRKEIVADWFRQRGAHRELLLHLWRTAVKKGIVTVLRKHFGGVNLGQPAREHARVHTPFGGTIVRSVRGKVNPAMSQ